jgi:hypothetical protein
MAWQCATAGGTWPFKLSPSAAASRLANSNPTPIPAKLASQPAADALPKLPTALHFIT